MKHIVFDIETIPQDETKLLALAPEFTAPANLKDPAKIEAAIARRKADYLADAALNWKTAEAVLIGAGDDTGIQSFTASTEKELAQMHGEGMFAFARHIDREAREQFLAIMAGGDVAKAARDLDMRDSTLRSQLAKWPKRGKAYAALAEIIRWRKSIKGQAGMDSPSGWLRVLSGTWIFRR